MGEITSLDCLPDLRPGFGPLSGIETALASGRGDLNLIHACDVFVSEPDWPTKLIEAAETSRAKCVVTMDEAGQVHPLCAVFHAACLPWVESALNIGRFRLLDLIEALGAERLPLRGPVWNVNTPDDWRSLQEVANGW
jgi:molybdopterin-guanine dinucleotide biosynthesis protein A